ncbi:MAG: hypothetical protein AMXMBFR42_08660 [Burkholderiales bacterium]
MIRCAALAIACAIAFAGGNAYAEPTVTNAWMRPAALGAKSADAYADLRTSTPTTLVAVRTTAARRVDLVIHDPRDAASVPHVVDRLALPAGETRFALKGSVLRMIDVAVPIVPGDGVPLVFEFVDAAGKATKVEAKVEVRGFAPSPARMR